MRLDQETLVKITGRKMYSAQVAWFRDYLGVEVPHDQRGPIITATAYEALVARACGLRAEVPVGTPAATDRPKLHLRSPRG